MRNKIGFTLIELLIVISILAILAMLGLASYTSTSKRSRDTKRRGDLASIQKALEQYFTDNSSQYPAAGTNCTGINSYFQGLAPTQDVQKNPYFLNCTPTSYCICSSSLEVLNTGNSSNSSCSWSATGSYYCLANSQ